MLEIGLAILVSFGLLVAKERFTLNKIQRNVKLTFTHLLYGDKSDKVSNIMEYPEISPQMIQNGVISVQNMKNRTPRKRIETNSPHMVPNTDIRVNNTKFRAPFTEQPLASLRDAGLSAQSPTIWESRDWY